MRMPVLFVGHGSPMNAIENNKYTNAWKEISKKIPEPLGIVAISAHWQTKGTRLNDSLKPRQIYDFYGFPQELYEVKYDGIGSPELADKIKKILGSDIEVDNSWGIDHGTWSVLKRIYPQANIPIIQVSLNYDMSFEAHFNLGKKLASLRDEGYLIFGSGNIVHNLGILDWSLKGGFNWADNFDRSVKQAILNYRFDEVVNNKGGLAVPTSEHYLPLICCLGAVDENDRVDIFIEGCVMGAISMTSYLFY